MSKGTSPTPQKKKSGWPKGKKRGPKSVGTIVLPKGITMTSDILENTRAYAAKHLRKRKKNPEKLFNIWKDVIEKEISWQITTRMEKIKSLNKAIKENQTL